MNSRGILDNREWSLFLSFLLSLVALPLVCSAQIGGRTSASGPLIIEDAEAVNLTAEGVGRAWIVDDTGVNNPLECVTPTGLTLAAGQSSAGVLRYEVKASHFYISYSYGVPLPGVWGESTLLFPGNVTSFTHLKLLTCSTANINNPKFMVILETYPGPNFPKLYWNFAAAPGTTFQERSINLREPELTENMGSLTVEQVLAQTRYISFYFYGETGQNKEAATIYLDDITFDGEYVPPTTTAPPTTVPPTTVSETTTPPPTTTVEATTTPTLTVTATPTAPPTTTVPPTTVAPTPTDTITAVEEWWML